MRRKKAVTAGLAMIAVGLVAAVLVISYHHTSVMLKGLFDLHPAPGEEEVHLVEWSSTKLYVVQRAAAFRGCVAEARDVDEGLGCIGRLISSIPPALARRSLAVAEDVQGEEGNDANPKLLAMSLARCLDAAQERDAAIFCLSDLLAAVPRESLEVAIDMGEAHPDFDWLGAKNHTRDSAKRFTRCVGRAKEQSQGEVCLGTLFASLPLGLVDRAQYVTQQLEELKVGEPKAEESVGGLPDCFDSSNGQDSAIFCLSRFLRGVPVPQIRAANTWADSHPDAKRRYYAEPRNSTSLHNAVYGNIVLREGLLHDGAGGEEAQDGGDGLLHDGAGGEEAQDEGSQDEGAQDEGAQEKKSLAGLQALAQRERGVEEKGRVEKSLKARLGLGLGGV